MSKLRQHSDFLPKLFMVCLSKQTFHGHAGASILPQKHLPTEASKFLVSLRRRSRCRGTQRPVAMEAHLGKTPNRKSAIQLYLRRIHNPLARNLPVSRGGQSRQMPLAVLMHNLTEQHLQHSSHSENCQCDSSCRAEQNHVVLHCRVGWKDNPRGTADSPVCLRPIVWEERAVVLAGGTPWPSSIRWHRSMPGTSG